MLNKKVTFNNTEEKATEILVDWFYMEYFATSYYRMYQGESSKFYIFLSSINCLRNVGFMLGYAIMHTVNGNFHFHNKKTMMFWGIYYTEYSNLATFQYNFCRMIYLSLFFDDYLFTVS